MEDPGADLGGGIGEGAGQTAAGLVHQGDDLTWGQGLEAGLKAGSAVEFQNCSL
jgi:hypothetical protein